MRSLRIGKESRWQSYPVSAASIFVLQAANIFVRSKKWPLEWIHLTSDRDRSSVLEHGERKTLQAWTTIGPHRSLLWFEVRLTDMKMASLSSTSSILHGKVFFYEVSIRYHLLEILTPKHWHHSININKYMISILFIFPLLWIAELARYEITCVISLTPKISIILFYFFWRFWILNYNSK